MNEATPDTEASGATYSGATTSNNNNSGRSSSSRGSDSMVLDNGKGSATRAFLQTRGTTHRDMTASPEASSRRNATFFFSPFCSDAAATSPDAPRRRPLTALALRQQTQLHVAAWQRRLSYELCYQTYVKAHEVRMRMLFGLDDSTRTGELAGTMTTSTDGGHASTYGSGPAMAEDAMAAGEAAYLRSLDPNKSEEEARVLRVIASIDKALKRQLASAYQRHADGADTADSTRNGGNATPADDDNDHTPGRSSGRDAFPTGSAAPHSTLHHTSSSTSLFFASRRPAIVEAVIASTSESVEVFVDQLLPYQQEGVRWLLRLNSLEHMNGILADDMGLGKTAQTVAYLACYKDMMEISVQRPLELLKERHVQLCQRALGLAAATAATVDEAAELELPPWLAWCTVAATEEGEEDRETTSVLISDHRRGAAASEQAAHIGSPLLPMTATASANPQLAAARACGRMIRLVKEVKRWLWQLEGVFDGEEASVEGALVPRTRNSSRLGLSSSSTSPSPAPAQPSPASGQALALSPQVNDASAASAAAVNAVSLLPLKRRRGRPPKHLSAMMAAAAAATGAGQPASSPRSSLTSSPAPPTLMSSQSLSSMIADQRRLANCSAGFNQRLEGAYTVFRPVLIIAPLSTLPHWASEFHRFSRRRAGAGGVGAGAGSAAAPSSAHVLSLRASAGAEAQDSQRDRFTVYVLNGARAEREERMRAFVEHIHASEEEQRQQHRQHISCGPAATPVLIIPHDMLTKPLSGPLRQIPRVRWHVVVIDEAQRIKSAQSTLFKKVRLLHSISRLVLTGTPLQNSTTELFSLLQFLAPQSFTSVASDLFEQLDSALIAAGRSTALEDRELHLLLCRRVHRLLMPFILRREKTILKTALPPIRDYAVLCPLLPFQKKQLEEVKRKHQEGTLSGNPHIQLRKILLHPYTTQSFFYVDEEVVQTSGKLLVLDFMMRFLQRTRHKFLVFCGWTLMLDVVETLCGMRGIPYVRLDGKTSVETREANIKGFNRPMQGEEEEGGADAGRANDVNRHPSRRRCRRNSVNRGGGGGGGGNGGRADFGAAAVNASGNDDAHVVGGDNDSDDEDEREMAPAPCCFLISKVAGGVGLNLQAADTVFLLDVDYNPQRDAQALSRVYRVGQTREVHVFRLVIDHPIERNIVAIHEAKENLGRAVVQAGRYDLHSSVQEREEALQHIFRSHTMSQLSQQWASTSPTSPTSPSTAVAETATTTTATTMDVGNDEEVDERGGRENAGAAVEVAAEDLAALNAGAMEDAADSAYYDFTATSPVHTPTDLHRVRLHHRDGGPTPSALKKPKTEGVEDEEEERKMFAEVMDFPATLDHLRPPQPPQQQRKRRHISFKLEGEAGEGSKDSSRSENSNTSGGDSRSVETSVDGAPSTLKGSKLFDAELPFATAAAETLADGEGGADDSESQATTPAAVAPAACLLAMRERLEEVLLRHDGERGVLQHMFRAVEASLASTKRC